MSLFFLRHPVLWQVLVGALLTLFEPIFAIKLSLLFFQDFLELFLAFCLAVQAERESGHESILANAQQPTDHLQ